jgi:hypothetical protein
LLYFDFIVLAYLPLALDILELPPLLLAFSFDSVPNLFVLETVLFAPALLLPSSLLPFLILFISKYSFD